MHSTGPTLSFRWPPARIVSLLCLYLIGASLAATAIELLTGLPDAFLDVAVLPIAEEAIKLWLFIKFTEISTQSIVSFGILELAVTKIPLILQSSNLLEFMISAIVSLPAFLFHTATAYSYYSSYRRVSAYRIFYFCLILHIIFNSLSLLGLHIGVWALSALVICALAAVGTKLISHITRGAGLGRTY